MRPGSRSKRALRRVLEMGQRLGIDVLPRHFYSQIPDLRELRNAQGWRVPRTMLGIPGAATERQLAFVAECCTPEAQARVVARDVYDEACAEEGSIGFGPVEADFLYCFVYSKRPARVVQVGCGVSTAILLAAAADAGYRPAITCIEPFPSPYLRRADSRGDVTLLAAPAQDIPLEKLLAIGGNDLLFVDSTHAVRPGSEVNRLILEVLPRLVSKTYVHFHDIYFPYDYSRRILVDDLFFWSETALLYAFLVNNHAYEVRASLSLLHHYASEEMSQLLKRYRPAPSMDGLAINGREGHFPSSAYLQVTA